MAKLYFYYAAMNAGKSTTLLQADFNYRKGVHEVLTYDGNFFQRVDVNGNPIPRTSLHT